MHNEHTFSYIEKVCFCKILPILSKYQFLTIRVADDRPILICAIYHRIGIMQSADYSFGRMTIAVVYTNTDNCILRHYFTKKNI